MDESQQLWVNLKAGKGVVSQMESQGPLNVPCQAVSCEGVSTGGALPSESVFVPAHCERARQIYRQEGGWVAVGAFSSDSVPQ